MRITSKDFYDNYYGHQSEYLKYIISRLKAEQYQNFIYLVGDSSLDNKYWLRQMDTKIPIPSQYESIINNTEPYANPDIAYTINRLLFKANLKEHVCINCAVEESTLSGRQSTLLPQDYIVRNNVTPRDTIIMSVGGNDIVLKPSWGTIANLASLALLPTFMLSYNPSFHYFVGMFRNGIENYIQELTIKSKPKEVILCGIYYPAEYSETTSSWADSMLGKLGYNYYPEKLQYIIDELYRKAICKVTVPGIKITTIGLHNILDPEDQKDYIQRVEPSYRGGVKMSMTFMELMKNSMRDKIVKNQV